MTAVSRKSATLIGCVLRLWNFTPSLWLKMGSKFMGIVQLWPNIWPCFHSNATDQPPVTQI